jgi:poly-gamma-glutamate system protein
MKKIYWRPSKVPRDSLLVIAMLAIAAISSVEFIKTKKKQLYYSEKISASIAMKKGMEVIKKYRIGKKIPIDKNIDPAESGIIGLQTSPITTKIGSLKAKQTTANPNWAAVMVELLKKAGIKKGDFVAVGLSGSFPAIALATYAAADALQLEVMAIASVGSSNYGANIPNITILDMERILHEAGVISRCSVAASLGGRDDSASRLPDESHKLLVAAIKRNKTQFIEADSSRESLEARMSIYHELSKGKPIAAYINVGGSAASVGTPESKRLFKPGLNRKPSARALSIDSVMSRFAKRGVPVIHMVQIDKLAQKYGLPKSPNVTPGVGEGHIFYKLKYNLYLATTNLFILLSILYIFLKSDIGYRIFGSHRANYAPKHPEPMV